MKKNAIKQILMMAFVSLMGASAFAEPPTMTKEQREKKAATMEKMAACLRSDKPMKDCHEEMKMSCGEDKEGCGMMMMHGKGMKHHGKGMMNHKKMMDGSAEGTSK